MPWLAWRAVSDRPNVAPSDILLHVNMMEPSNLLQQQAIGILGVNLLYAAFDERRNPEQLLKCLFSGPPAAGN